MPQVSAAVLRSKPSSTSASASIRRAAALFFSPPAALRSSEAVRSSRVIDTAVPIDAAPLKREHRARVSLIWESLTSHSLGPLVSDLVHSIQNRMTFSFDERRGSSCSGRRAQFAGGGDQVDDRGPD